MLPPGGASAGDGDILVVQPPRRNEFGVLSKDVEESTSTELHAVIEKTIACLFGVVGVLLWSCCRPKCVEAVCVVLVQLDLLYS